MWPLISESGSVQGMSRFDYEEATMGREKEERTLREEAREAAARRDGRLCPYCSSVIPYGTELGSNSECPSCVGAVKED